jgi:hypothetical protein
MISVVVYGRNDSHGYNLPKRAAISLNCIAEQLDDKNDEIIFVDCNTPNDIPTFPESIADTLTSAAKRMLRILRLRPEQYSRSCGADAKFKVKEALCRNIAIRRSNPDNRWILNTNTDMVFAPLVECKSLSRIVSELQDAFYELPRFEIPESLWESTNRMDPANIIASFKYWGLKLHLNEIITASKEALFDAPGDFQLALRKQLFQIQGMNERMNLWAHIDSNLCKRMWLLNGSTRSILDKLYAFHCDHTRFRSVYHANGNSTENNYQEFFLEVSTPYLPEQANFWGMPDEQIEEISLVDRHTARVRVALGQILPGMNEPIAVQFTGCNAFNVGLYYDNCHVLPYLADIIANIAPMSDVGYIGNNSLMLSMLADFRQLIGHTGKILYDPEILHIASSFNAGTLPSSCHSVMSNELYENASTFVFDLSMKNIPSRPNESGLPIPEKCSEALVFAKYMSSIITEFGRREKKVLEHCGLLKPFIFVGCHSTIYDPLIQSLFSCAVTPGSTYIRNGFVSPEAFDSPPPILPLHFYIIGSSPEDITAWISNHLGRPVGSEDVRMAKVFYSMFVEAKEQQKMLDALETLLSFDAGRGWLQMQIEIAGINGVPEHGEALRRFIEDYKNRWHSR